MQHGFVDAAPAVASADAFDCGLECDVPLAPQDFIVKPARLPERLDRLARRLDPQWLGAARAAPPATPSAPLRPLAHDCRLEALLRRIDQDLTNLETP